MSLELAYHSYLKALLEGDRHGAFDAVDRARAAGAEPRDVYLEILQRALREIGRLWQENEISVADEHLATAITQAAMTRLFDDAVGSSLGGGPTLVAACADVERHEIGLRMVCDLLELEGWDTVFLGARVPISSLVELVREREPAAVALSASLMSHLPRLRAMIEAIRAADGRRAPLIIVGGRPFHDRPQLAQEVGADLTALDAREAVELLLARAAT